MSDNPPLILYMENAAGEEVALRIEPEDDFQSFLDKAKSMLGYDVDLNSVTKNQSVSLTDSIYQFLIKNEQFSDGTDLSNQNLDKILENDTDDQVYVLNDGTQIRASQIHFDNEDPLVDLTVERIPFVRYAAGIDDEEIHDIEVQDTRLYNIIESPVASKCASPKCSFVNSLPFKLVSNNPSAFETQFTKYLEANTNKSYATLNNVTSRKSPRSLIRDNYKNYDENFQNHRNTDDFTHYTREEILNMFKDSPVASLPYDSQHFSEKRRHVRKSDPSRLYLKSWNSKPISYIDVDGVLIAESESQNCFICNKFVDNNVEKLYLFDNEDQRLYRSSPMKKLSTQLKIICVQCLEDNFQPCRMKSPNQSLNPDEYLVIRNNQQYIFQKTNNLIFKNISKGSFTNIGEAKAIIDKVESEVLKDKERSEFVKVEIGSDGEIVTKPLDNDIGSDDVIIVKDETKDASSSDVEIIDNPENEPEIDDNVIDNIEDADEDVKAFLGRYQCDEEGKELKCRFCDLAFGDINEVISHGDTHKHVLDEGEVFPCPLCDYGYANPKYLKGHLKAAHHRTLLKVEKEEKNAENAEKKDDTEMSAEKLSPVASRTRSAAKKGDSDPQKDTPENQEGTVQVTYEMGAQSDFVIKTEVKQETVESSDDEIWIVQTADAEGEMQLRQILNQAQNDKEVGSMKHKCSCCSLSFSSEDSLASHKCKRRARKRKTSRDDMTIRVPSKEDFMKRAQGRTKFDESGDDSMTVRPRRRKNKEPSSDPQIVTCHNCNESFTSKVRLKFHMQFHESGRSAGHSYSCSECSAGVFGTETELFDHVHFRHKHKRWQCPVQGCGKTFYLRATLTKHSRTHTDTRRYACDTCGKRFLDKQTLDEHGVTHLQIKPFQCHICLKQLTRRSRLRMHVRAHEEAVRPRLVLACGVCRRAFRDHTQAQDHVNRSPECIEEFANELKEEESVTVQLSPTSGLVRHTVQVVESPKLSKPIRRQVFGPLADSLLSQVADEARAIVRVVEIEKAFRCEYCEDVFYCEEGLNNHRVIHKGIKNPFTCHICKVSFATYSRCTTHKTTHGFYKRSVLAAAGAGGSGGQAGGAGGQAGGSPRRGPDAPSSAGILGYGDFPVVKHFLCEDCGRSYLHWTYLQVHRRMKHALENYKYKCNQCDVTFANSWSLTYHKKKNHMKFVEKQANSREEYRIPCRDCDEVLQNKTALYKHRKKEHSDCGGKLDTEVPRAAPAHCAASRQPPPGSGAPTREAHNHDSGSWSLCRKIEDMSGQQDGSGRSDSRRCCGANRTGICNRFQMKRPTIRQTCVYEVPGLNPSPDQVMEHLTLNNIPHDRVIEITKMSFAKGTSSVIPDSARALAMLSHVPQTQVACSREKQTDYMYQTSLRERTFMRNFRKPKILQSGATLQQGNSFTAMTHSNGQAEGATNTSQEQGSYPVTLNVSGEDLSELNVQLLLQNGVLVNGNQMVQLRLDENMMME